MTIDCMPFLSMDLIVAILNYTECDADSGCGCYGLNTCVCLRDLQNGIVTCGLHLGIIEDGNPFMIQILCRTNRRMPCSILTHPDNERCLMASLRYGGYNWLKEASIRLRDNYYFVGQFVDSCGASLVHASERLRNNETIAVRAVKTYIHALQYCSAKIRASEEFVRKLMGLKIKFHLADLSKSLRGSKDIVLYVVRTYGYDLHYASTELKDLRSIVIAAVKSTGEALQFASKALRNDHDVVTTAVNNNGYAIRWASAKLKDNKRLVLRACATSLALPHASSRLHGDSDIAMASVVRHGWSAKYLSAELRDDMRVMSAAVKQFPYALKYASGRIRPQLTIVALENDGLALRHMPTAKDQWSKVMIAVSQNGLALQYAAPTLANTPLVVMTACMQNGLALKYASYAQRSNHHIVLAAVRSYGNSLKYAIGCNDIEHIVVAAVRHTPAAIRYASDRLRKSYSCYTHFDTTDA